MMGSPCYYDVLFDDEEFLSHDCMWSGICTCCMQLLHQDFRMDETPCEKFITQLPSTQHQQYQTTNQYNNKLVDNVSNNNNLINQINSNTNNSLNNNENNKLSPTTTTTTSLSSTATLLQPHQQNHNQSHHPQHNHQAQQLLQDQGNSLNLANATTNTSPTTIANSSLNNFNNNYNTILESASTSSSSSSTASSSTTTSPKPQRRREHNDSERKRRDHLRNAFNFLRDQVPRFKQMNKKPPRIQILHEATKYVQCIMKESQDIEKRLEEERSKYARMKQQLS